LLETAEARPVLDQVKRARTFVGQLRDRQRTIERIATFVVERQWAFVRFGPQFIQPLTRSEVAAELDLHESTVSRAAAHKHVLLPDGRMPAFADFFDSSLAIEEIIRIVIADEPQALTDADLVEGLRARGYRLARRTVAKYRLRLGVPIGAARAAARASSPGPVDRPDHGEDAFV
jgi:RNA polymerase sigma-54 factor